MKNYEKTSFFMIPNTDKGFEPVIYNKMNFNPASHEKIINNKTSVQCPLELVKASKGGLCGFLYTSDKSWATSGVSGAFYAKFTTINHRCEFRFRSYADRTYN